MGKSLFKSLVAGVRVFKSPSKERPSKDDKVHVKKRSKDKCFGSLGKSASRNRDVIVAAAGSPEAIEIKCVQVESEKLKDVLPVSAAQLFTTEPHAESNAPIKRRDGVINGSGFVHCVPIGLNEHHTASDQEEWAASKIQAAFRCYLAQRAFRALKALVRLQALARGHIVRRRASISLQCMNALIRIQALARGRRVRSSELGQLVQKHLQQSKQTKKKSPEGWVNSTATAQQLHAKAQVKHDAVTKRQRALVYAYSEQLNRHTPKASSILGLDSQVDRSHWIWEWMDRWTAAAPKGGSAAVIPVENCIQVTRNIDKGKSSNKGGKQSENSRKERRKWSEHAERISPRDLISEEFEEPSMVVKRKDDMMASPESEKLGTPKASVQKPILQSPTPSPSLLSPLKESNAAEGREISLPDVQPLAMSPDVIQAASSSCMTEATLGSRPISFISETLTATENGTNLASEAEKTRSSENTVITSSPSFAAQVSPSSSTVATTNGHAVHATSEVPHVRSDFLSEESKENSLSTSSVSPQEKELSATLSEVHLSKENLHGFSPVTHVLSIAEVTENGSSSVFCQPDEIVQVTIRDIDMHSPFEAVDSINGDKGEDMSEESGYSIDGHVTELRYEPGDVIQEGGQKNDNHNHVDASSETNEGCDDSIISAGARSTDASTKNPSVGGLKHEQAECTSPSLPSYMATTKSSKAKIRTLTSPKQKPDSAKTKLESPKPKSESPKTKADSPSQKPDSASKRRQSLSALDGKVSPGIQKPTFHVRASSKGNFSSFKDLSVDNLSLPNGDSRRHGK